MESLNEELKQQLKNRLKSITDLTNGFIEGIYKDKDSGEYMIRLAFSGDPKHDTFLYGYGKDVEETVKDLEKSLNEWIKKRTDVGIKLPWEI